MNESENTIPNLWDSVKAVPRVRFIAISAYLKKQERNQTNNLTTPKATRKKKKWSNPGLVEGKKA